MKVIRSNRKSAEWVFRTIYDRRPAVYGKSVQTDLAKLVKNMPVRSRTLLALHHPEN
jgi:hypothetical protein